MFSAELKQVVSYHASSPSGSGRVDGCGVRRVRPALARRLPTRCRRDALPTFVIPDVVDAIRMKVMCTVCSGQEFGRELSDPFFGITLSVETGDPHEAGRGAV